LIKNQKIKTMNANDEESQQAMNGDGRKMAYKISEVARLLSISESSVRRAIKNGELKAVKIFRHLLIPATEIERFLTIRN